MGTQICSFWSSVAPILALTFIHKSNRLFAAGAEGKIMEFHRNKQVTSDVLNSLLPRLGIFLPQLIVSI